MRTMLAIAAFELRSRLRLVSTYVYLALYVAITALWIAAAGGAFEMANVSFGSEKVLINGPYALGQLLTLAGFMGVSVIAASMGRAVQQDFEHGTFHFFFSAPIAKRDYVLGRFLGAYATLILVFAGIAIGAEIGVHWPGVDPTRIGPETLSAYLRPYFIMLLPNMLWLGAAFFMLAALTRQMAPVYVGGVLVLIGYLVALGLMQDMENKTRAALLDPVGSVALTALTRYWSVADRNARPIPFEGLLLWNRLLWTGIGAIVFAAGYRAFRMEAGNRTGAARRERKARAAEAAATASGKQELPAPRIDRSTRAWIGALPGLSRLYLVEILRRPIFLVIVLAGALFMLINASAMGAIYGTTTWPVTYEVLELTSGLFGLFVLVVTAIYAGELVWRERDAKMDDIVDATPYPGWLPFAAKLITLYSVQALLLVVVLACTMAIQLWYHYTRFELPHALFELFALQLPGYFILGALVLAIHVVVNQKYVGHFLVILWFVANLKMPDFGFEDRLTLYGATPTVAYSDMNGYGHFLPGTVSFLVYWGAWAVMLLAVAQALWVRGRETRLATRAQRLRSPGVLGTAIAALVAAMASGAWIFHNTHVVNPFLSQHDKQARLAEYEKRYKALEFVPQPKIASIDADVEIYPREHRTRLKGRYTIVNRSAAPIGDLYVLLPSIATVDALAADIALTPADQDPDLGWRHFKLAQPLEAGASTGFTFDVSFAVKGFTNDGALDTVLDNGTFLNAAFGRGVARMPVFGYDPSIEMTSDRDRKKFGLAPKERALDLDDPRGPAIGTDWIDHYAATVSTDEDQIAITSGKLEKTWKENGRAYFRYTMDTKALAFVPFLSGRYAVKKDRWSDGSQDVDIEIDYHAWHTFDVDRMIAGVKDSLDYFTKNFSPYQHSLVRIIEFPRYQSFAESFPNTVPFSEAIGFIARVDDDDPKDIDYPYFVTAHEVAHQWWGHQTTPAFVQGGEFLNESLAEYSALLVLKHRYGEQRMRRFLRYELDRYLQGRGAESKKEQPLMRADGPAYLHYQKGALAFYALQDVIGEDKVNEALRAFVSAWGFRGPPYPTSRALMEELKKVTPPESLYAIEDLFETITLFEFETTDATIEALPDGKFEVTVKARAKKLRADGLGAQTEVTMKQPVDVGAVDDQGLPLFLEKRVVASGENTFTFVVDKRPAKAGVDPLCKLINRHPDDAMHAVSDGS